MATTRKKRKITKYERDTYDRLVRLMYEGKIWSFTVPAHDKWEVFDTEEEWRKGSGVDRARKIVDGSRSKFGAVINYWLVVEAVLSPRTFLTQAKVRAKYNMDKEEVKT